MVKYAIKRVLLMLFTLFVIMTMCFVLIKLLPMPTPRVQGRDLQLILRRREAMGYNKPILVQYGRFLENVLTKWDWGLGEQMYVAQDVWKILVTKLPYTISVNLYSILVAIPIGLAFGIYAALKKNKWQDHVISTAVMIFISVPSYIYAFLVQYLLCFKAKIFPIVTPSLEETGLFSFKMFWALMPAIISLGFGVVAGLTRYTRAELSEVLTGDYMLLARTKGLTKAQATARHAMRNAMVVILPMIIGEFIGIMSGSLIIEGIFSVPGIGSLYLDSITNATMPDYPVFMMMTVFYTFVGLLSGVIIDISYGFIDPRIRMGSRK